MISRSIRTTLALAVSGTIIATTFQASPQQSPLPDGDPARGAQLYKRVCAACHSLDANRIGPMHRGVVGRPVASVEGFHYSAALSAQTFTWDTATLDQWLTNPPDMVPGTAMGIRVPKPQDRADIISYLRQEGGQPAP
ncbi:MAG TPA: cytochrome c family protein [Verrucomicrobiae bacterium]|jgi:cytochrome c|nr:cytochrome c family protein [Verrucomicrobiae bacterium]